MMSFRTPKSATEIINIQRLLNCNIHIIRVITYMISTVFDPIMDGSEAVARGFTLYEHEAEWRVFITHITPTMFSLIEDLSCISASLIGECLNKSFE